MKIQAVIAANPKSPFLVEEVELGEPRANEVVVRVVGAGLCHTDLVARDKEYPVPHPLVVGHEGSGIIHAVGDAVTKVAVGDAVVMTFVTCGNCDPCHAGKPAYCKSLYDLNFSGGRPDGSTPLSRDGKDLCGCFFGQSSMADYCIASENNIVKVTNSSVPLELLGPLGCGVQTGAGAVINSLQPPAGSSIAIFGMGSVGLSGVMAAKLVGCSKIIAVDILDSRLEKAVSLGATHTINSSDKDPVEAIREITDGKGAEFSLDMVGRPEVLRAAITCLGSLGTCGLVGAAPFGVDASFEMADLLFHGRRIMGICEGDSVPEIFIPRLIELYAAGLFPLDKLVTKFKLEDINEAVEAVERGDVVKAILIPS
ncbi:NAD(P)-dependent alcohol dehydrogenase [Roseovarius sp. Pro17]|uniref:NAD(P)-dependent alcohol dehydrogenase n=1 Tax=Roseovarius sp. Pro17 TaxID=3108175 RepID=UPI002D7960A1|nr:NAD(P)-dependent alcohol dehydrogenase [Roseovarius sp. Pro17]